MVVGTSFLILWSKTWAQSFYEKCDKKFIIDRLIICPGVYDLHPLVPTNQYTSDVLPQATHKGHYID